MKQKEQIVLKAGIFNVIGNMILKGIAFFSIPIFIRIMSKEDYGLYSTYIAYVGILSVIITLGLNNTIKLAKFDFGDNIDEYMSSVITLIFFPTFTLLSCIIIFNNFTTLYIDFNIFVLIAMVIESFSISIINVQIAKYQAFFNYKKFLLISGINSISNIILSVIFICTILGNNSFLGRMLGAAVSSIMISIIVLLKILRKGKKIYSSLYWSYGIKVGSPLIIFQLSNIILAQFDRIMIQRILGNIEAGLYSFTYNISNILQIIWSSISNVWSTWLIGKLKEKNYILIKRINSYYIIGFTLLTVTFICVTPEVIKILATSDYYIGMNLAPSLCLGVYMIFVCDIYVQIEMFLKNTKVIAIVTAIAAIVNILLNIILIPKYGYIAAAYTTAISYIVAAIINRITLARYFKIRDILSEEILAISSLGVITITLGFPYIIDFILLRWSIAIVIILIVIFILKKEHVNKYKSKRIKH